jgi:hypothetical protein
MKLRSFFLGLGGGVLLAGAGGAWFAMQSVAEIKTQTLAYLENSSRIERSFIERLPIYEDFATPARESALRTYLLADHLAAARRYGIAPIERDAELKALVDAGALTEAVNTAESLYFFYNVPKKYRYLTPDAKAGLEKLAERLQSNLRRRGEYPPVKIAISSMLRPASYQERLRDRNGNASQTSSHSYGVSFDVFYDEYYVALPAAPEAGAQAEIIADLRRRLGYLQGQSLRRQFHAALMETLLQLQDEGALYAILEKSQRCYHVTILGRGDGNAGPTAP